ncbi:hypothetical protein MIDIC_190002 [Alphaproteobacteria bacterium]
MRCAKLRLFLVVTVGFVLQMAGIAQVVRAQVCGTWGRGFEFRCSPHLCARGLFVFIGCVCMIQICYENWRSVAMCTNALM